MILSTDDSPVVFSISYGWQGPLKQIGCEPTNSMDFDTDLAAIAAKDGEQYRYPLTLRLVQ